MRITVLTLFPEAFTSFLGTSIIARAIARDLVSVDFVNIRDFARDRYKHVDDTPFGGGAGMIMKCQPVLDALAGVKEKDSHTVLLSPAAPLYNQAKARQFAEYGHLIIICGHYEGTDARISNHVDETLSVGDYVLTGGETGALVIMDSVIRLLKGAISDASTNEESFTAGLLEYPQYTQPADYNGEKVPEVLLSGHHENIRKWRLLQSLKITSELRPDLFAEHELTDEEKKILEKHKSNE